MRLRLAVALAALLLPTAAIAQPAASPTLPAPAEGAAPAEAGRAPQLPTPQSTPLIPTLPSDRTDLAYGAYQRGLYVSALKYATARVEANRNDTAAMTLLGELYAQGLAVPQDFAEAASWYRLAHEKGDANATFALAMLAMDGLGLPKNRAQAETLLEQAAAKGHPVASYNLALLLLPRRTEGGDERAVALLERAAQAEIADAQYALAVLYREGRGVPVDRIRMANWLARAADNGNLPAQVEYAIALFNGDGTARSEEEAARWFERAAWRGNPIAQNRLARILAAGRGRPTDLVEAAAWHMLAAQAGLADSWLDDTLKTLTDAQRKAAADTARERAERLEFGIGP
ncbi:TPR repeat [Chelatococcus sambhunathii]|uniref:Sel1 repeat family protein n=4 Tax=Chelatococcus TaxID=28209 RepID=A0AAC9JTC4_9HYPH|nr:MULTISPECIES: tetratricopeptide repeat protein [Chelatococcus]APF38275.1 hypothetical protein BOQ54_13860 [Chelatococcus daeguensis]CUA84625.1 TPR repeat [Chelatococcus sambhunathii]